MSCWIWTHNVELIGTVWTGIPTIYTPDKEVDRRGARKEEHNPVDGEADRVPKAAYITGDRSQAAAGSL
jgi:hypothetical protein